MSNDNNAQGSSMPSNEHYENTYGNRRNDESQYGRPQQNYRPRGNGFGGRGRGRRNNNFRPRSRNFVLDFNRFANRPEIQKRVTENFADRLQKGDTKELFHWASPPLNDYRVGNTIYVRFENEADMHQYMITAKFMRGEIQWKHSMPDGVRYEFRLKKLN